MTPPHTWSNRKVNHAIPDVRVLELLELGRYKVCQGTGEVTGPRGKVVSTWMKAGHLFVRIHEGKKRRGIALGKLVWMSVSKVPVPPGFDIHHDDEDPEHNCWENLICLHRLDHEKTHLKNRTTEELPF